MTELVARTRLLAPTRPTFGGLLIVERNAMVYRRTWLIIVSGFFEPLFYLFFFVYPLERFIGDITSDGETLEYAAFVAPALLASSAMNGAFYDATNVFWKLRYGKVYDSILATPIGPKDVAVERARPAQQLAEAARARRGGQLAARARCERVDRRAGVGLLVRVRPDHDHRRRPFVWLDHR